ncbi:MAG: asparagine synthase (glutamine-hydrolyzing) [Candidatus Rokubacteria bacterium]|nr:asparagine synthase (glutamine-hydrolyzing) [Candidatus Rokubacteria bacterium]
MCGICGFVNLDGSPAVPEILGLMQAAIHHRGPDSQGVHLEGVAGGGAGRPPVGLASTRLKIIDLSESARQPLSNEDDQLWIVFNGEIYNFAGLADRLAARGHRFKSRSDTEVILHLYEERGEACVQDLDGMFAFALWDRPRGRLFLARDRVGKKPLFYWSDGKTFLFASEIKALLQHPSGPVEVDASAIAPFLIFGYVPGPRTFYRGVRQVPPGHTLTVDATGRPRLSEYWDLKFPDAKSAAGNRAPRPAEVADRVRGLVTEAVRKRLISDVPLGAFLSGGIDSTIVVGVMSRLSPAPVKTFTIGFRDAPGYDETTHARAVARRFGTDHTEYVVESEAADLLEPLIWHHDGPFRDSSAIPSFVLSRLAREKVTVVLNGDGGDELFAGYRRFYATLLAERLPDAALRLGEALLSRLPRSADRRARLDRLSRFVRSARLPFYERFSESFGTADLALDRLLRPELLAESRLRQSDYFGPHLERIQGCSPLSRLLYLNFKTYLLDDLLVKMDRCTMAHGLEARSPLLDVALVEYAATVPDGMKLSGGTSKVVLKRAFADLLPGEIRRRGKMGFGVPMAYWLRTNLQKVVRDVLSQPTPRLRDYLDATYVRSLVDAHLEGRADHSALLWSLLTLELWLEQLPAWRRPLPDGSGRRE